MPRESTITVLRSTTTDVPTGLTFGEIAYSDLNGKFHIGKGDGTSLWIGAQITAGDITTNSQYIIPTQSAVKSYVDGAIGGGSGVVNTVNATGGAITITGDGGALFNTQAAKANTVGVRLATTGVTGVASFNSTYFSVSSGAVSLASAYQATGDTVITTAGSGIAISTSGKTDTLFNIGVTGFNGLTGNITLTGDGGSQIGADNNKFTNRLATTGVTGVASFNSSYFSVASGAVSLASAYQATGDTVQAGSGIAISANKTITNIGVTTFNGLTGGITVTGDGGSLVGKDNNRFTNRLADTSVTGVASFLSTNFTVTNGVVALASAYAVTGTTIITVPGSGIALSTSGKVDTILNIGVTGFNGLTGGITVTGDGGSLVGKDNNKFTNRFATTGVTGVASFLSTHFTVGATGHVSLATAYQATGDTVVQGIGLSVARSGNSTTITNEGVLSINGQDGTVILSGDNGALSVDVSDTVVKARLASTSLTGVASFNSSYFSVSSGAVSLAAAYQATGDSVQAGSGIVIGSGKTITNIGVTGVNGLTGNITVTGDGGSLVGIGNNKFTNRVADTSVTGVASFNSSYFSVSSGAVSLASAYQVTGDTVITTAGSGIAISTSGKTDTLFNIGVTGFNGLTGGITVTGDGGSLVGKDNNKFTNRVADTGVTGVASFNSSYFSVSSGAVSLASAYQATGNTVLADGGALSTTTSGNTKTVLARVADTSVTGVASFNSSYFSVSSGAVSLASAYQATGNTVLADGGALSTTTSGNTKTVLARLASASLTGVASFNSTHFTVSGAGAVSSTGITIKASSADAGTTLNLGGTLTITGTANQTTVSRSNTDFTIGLPNDITIPGNLTVNGTVVTANVDSFVVEDPLIMLGTGNAADSVDLGFYGQYTSSGKRFAGIFRDASDSGKFKFFTGLSGGVEPTTFVNDAGSGYTVATIVTKIDGGTF